MCDFRAVLIHFSGTRFVLRCYLLVLHANGDHFSFAGNDSAFRLLLDFVLFPFVEVP